MMAEQANDIVSITESGDSASSNTSPEDLEGEVSTSSTFAEIVSSLPPEAVESCKKAHDAVIEGLVPSSSSLLHSAPTSSASSSTPLLSFRHPVNSDSTPLLASSHGPYRSNTHLLGQQPGWIEHYLRMIQQCFGKRHPPQKIVTIQSVYEAIFTPTIVLEIKVGPNRYKSRTAVVMIDFHCKYNLISRRLGDKFFNNLGSEAPYQLILTLGPGEGEANAIKKVSGRWSCKNNPMVVNPWLRFDKTMQDAEFHIMERSNRYDVIIGEETIVKFDILGLKRDLPLAAPQNFRSLPYGVTTAIAQDYDARLTSAQLAEEEERRQYKEWLENRHQFAQKYAEPPALAYATDQVARFGYQVWRQAYNQAFANHYAEGENIFQQHNPRPGYRA